MSDIIHVRALVTGKVQGVFFRASTLEQAQSLGVTGGVQNLADGGVEVEAQGAADAVELLVSWLHRGPPAARVESVHVTSHPVDETLKTFRVSQDI